MTREEMAKRLHGSEYGSVVSRSLAKEAEESGLVIVYGASDDLVELEGAIEDEAGRYDGGDIHLNKNGLIQNKCTDAYCPYFEHILNGATKIKAIWNGVDDGVPSWTYETDIPHDEFSVMEDGEVYCRGIVFELKDIR